ncbi:hypothetical protein GCM10027592_24740 [Spirosoma flavus]
MSELDRLRIWHPIYKPSEYSISTYSNRDDYTYETFDELLQQAKEGRKIDALSIDKEVWKKSNIATLSQLKTVRLLNLNGLTTGQTDSLFQVIQDWSSLERLIVFEAPSKGNKKDRAQLLTVPEKIQRFSKLTDIRLNGDYRLWQSSIEKVSGLKMLDLNQMYIPSTNTVLLDLNKLSQLEALKITGQNWIINQQSFSNLKQLNELSLVAFKVDTTTFQQTINGLPGLKILTIDNICELRKLNLNRLSNLKEFNLLNNAELVLNANDFASLSNLERLTIQLNQPIDLTGICALSNLRTLRILGRGTLLKAPECLSQLIQLTELRIENLKLDRLPVRIGALRQLKSLSLNNCGLESLPADISQLTALQELRLDGNKLVRLPDLGQMHSLNQLNVIGNQLTTLPDDLGQLVKLTSLQASRNKLTQLPASLSRLVDLRSLNVVDNNLERLPDDIGRLRKLHFLSLHNNKLQELPNSVGQIDSLEVLFIGNNRLKSLPGSISRLKNLYTLQIGTNSLTTLPADWGGLVKLKELSIDANPITELPSSICELRNLETLSIMGTQIRLLPENIGALTKLRQVTLSNNELIALPNSIGRWQDVMNLSLDRNKLEGLPNSIGRLTKLITLRITGKDKVTEGSTGGLQLLPDSLVYCTSLWNIAIERQPQLDADDTFLKLAKLNKLFTLSLTECNISRLPALSWKDVNWSLLRLHNNLLTELPVNILDAPKLNAVSLWGNQLPDMLNRDFYDKEGLRVGFVDAGLLPLGSLRKPNRRVTMAYQQLAAQKAGTRDWSGAMSALEKAIDYAPDTILSMPYAQRASMHFFRKEYAEALADYDKAIQYAPQLRKDKLMDTLGVNRNLATYWQQKAAIMGILGKQDDALKAITQAERYVPILDQTPLSGLIYTEKGRYLALKEKQAEADSSFSKAMDLYEKLPYSDPGIRLTAVELGLLTGRYTQAKNAMNKVDDKELRDGFEILKEYLSTCLSIVQNEKTETQATTHFTDYLAKHPARVYGWSFDLFDNWLTRTKLSPEKITALRQLTDLVKERLTKP